MISGFHLCCRLHNAAGRSGIQSETMQASFALQADAEQKAAVSAKEGLQRKLKEAEARVESLAETVEELRNGLARQQAAADLR